MTNKTLYKKDSKGNIRYLTMWVQNESLIQESGIVGTENPIVNISTCEAKNVGKSNETTPTKQAELELESKYTEKLRLGYFTTKEEAALKGGNEFLLPMLAKDFKKEEVKVTYPCFAQPKLDGMRAFGTEENTMTSRTGKHIDTITHIKFDGLEENILDGELYCHGKSFQEQMKLIKKYRKGETEQVKYHVYDMVLDLPFEERHAKLVSFCKSNPHIEIVETVTITSKENLLSYHQSNLAKGYEGTMIRHGEDSYALNKRSSSLLKFKDFIDEVYEVVDIVPSEKRPEQGIVVCKTNNVLGEVVTFNTGMKFSHSDREEILINKENYIGKSAEIRFFEFTDDGLPRFPVCYGFRIDK